MSDIGIPVATLRQMATGQLLRVVHTILTIIAEQLEANLPVGGEEAPGTVASCQAQCLEQDFQVSDLFGGPIFGTARRSQKWDRWLNLLSFIYYNTETVPKMGPFRGPVFGTVFRVF